MSDHSSMSSRRQARGRDVNDFALEYQEQYGGRGGMQGFASVMLSLIAIGLSSVTTYLSFFDERYTLSASIAKIESQTQTSSSKSGDGPLSVSYRTFVTPTLIISNRGSRPLVLSDVRARKSSDIDTCASETSDAAVSRFGSSFKPIIIEPGTVRDLKYNFSTGNMTNDFETRSELWCLSFVIFDHRGKRLEPLMRTVKLDYRVVPSTDERGTGAPKLESEITYPRQAMTLATSGLYGGF